MGPEGERYILGCTADVGWITGHHIYKSIRPIYLRDLTTGYVSKGGAPNYPRMRVKCSEMAERVSDRTHFITGPKTGIQGFFPQVWGEKRPKICGGGPLKNPGGGKTY